MVIWLGGDSNPFVSLRQARWPSCNSQAGMQAVFIQYVQIHQRASSLLPNAYRRDASRLVLPRRQEWLLAQFHCSSMLYGVIEVCNSIGILIWTICAARASTHAAKANIQSARSDDCARLSNWFKRHTEWFFILKSPLWRASAARLVGRFGCAVLNAIRVVELNTNELGVIYNLYPYFDLAESAESAPLKKRSRIFFPLFFSLWSMIDMYQ
jgi:hypothetical protein